MYSEYETAKRLETDKPTSINIQEVLNGYFITVNGKTFVIQGDGNDDFAKVISFLSNLDERVIKPKSEKVEPRKLRR